MKDTFEGKKDQAIRAILDAAMEIFAEVGFAGARVDEIARRAGVNKAMIYYRVGNKSTLYSEVLHRLFSGIVERLSANIEAVRSPEEMMRAYIRTFAAEITEQPFLPPIMLREMASGGHDLPDVVVTDLGRILTILQGILEKGSKAGVFTHTNPSIVHLMIIGPMILRSRMNLITSRRREHARTMRLLDKGEPPDVAAEIEKLILGALIKQFTTRQG